MFCGPFNVNILKVKNKIDIKNKNLLYNLTN